MADPRELASKYASQRKKQLTPDESEGGWMWAQGETARRQGRTSDGDRTDAGASAGVQTLEERDRSIDRALVDESGSYGNVMALHDANDERVMRRAEANKQIEDKRNLGGRYAAALKSKQTE